MGLAHPSHRPPSPTRNGHERGLPGTTTTPTTRLRQGYGGQARREPDVETRRWGDKETATAPHLLTAGEAKPRCSPLAHDHRSSIVATRSRPPGLIREANNP